MTQILTTEQMEKLTTPRLKAYLHSIHTAHTDEKETDEWKDLHERVVAVLNTREHVEKKGS